MENFVLNEFYFGKHPNLISIESLLADLRKKYTKLNPVSDRKAFKELIHDSILRDIEGKINQTFGFNETKITVARVEYLNAFTIPTLPLDSKGNLNTKALSEPLIKIDKTGMKFDKTKYPMNLIAIMTAGLLVDQKMGEGEVVAILLHEIGHNFARFIIDIKHDDDTSMADERFSDQFVAMYGYSMELNKALSKISYDRSEFEEKLSEIPGINVIMALKNLTGNILFSILTIGDPHPTLKSRFESQIDQMESDLKYTPNLTDKQKKELESNIKFCKKYIDDFFGFKTNKIAEKLSKFFDNKILPHFPDRAFFDNRAKKKASGDVINNKLTNIYKNSPSEDKQLKGQKENSNKSKKGYFSSII